MTPRLTLATASRVLTQLRHDHRTIALIIVLPCVVLGLIAWLFDGTPVLNQFGPVYVGIFPVVVMFLVTSVATLRERTSGTLERLMSLPLGKGDFVVGYALAFGLLAIVQALVLVAFTVWVCGMDVAGELWVLVLCAVLSAILGSALGLAASALARTEFQAVQLMPATLFPQLILCGLAMPRAQMPEVLEALSRVFPLTYVVDALGGVARGLAFTDIASEVGLVALFIVAAVLGGSLTLRRRTP